MSNLPAVSIVCPNVGSNALGRAMLLAQLLETHTSVRLVGVCRGPKIWGPAASLSVPIESFPLSSHARYSPAAIAWLRRTVGRDLVVVSKTLPHSLGFALAAGIGLGRMVIDIDDWESGFAQLRANEELAPSELRRARRESLRRRLGFNAFAATCLLEAVTRRAPHRLVSNRWLQSRFGGDILYHVRDPAELDPLKAKRPPEMSLSSDRPWVAFVGTPRRHKGLDVLVEALVRVSGPAAPGLVLMGADPSAQGTIEAARSRLPNRFAVIDQFPFDRLADYLSLADIIAIPSLNVASAWGQIPAKLFDALAMAKPVVVSDINDMREIADGCGLVVPPGDVGALSDAVERLSADETLRRTLGRAGREKFLSRFTHAAGREVLLKAVRRAAA